MPEDSEPVDPKLNQSLEPKLKQSEHLDHSNGGGLNTTQKGLFKSKDTPNKLIEEEEEKTPVKLPPIVNQNSSINKSKALEIIKDEEEKQPLSPKKQPTSTQKKALANDKSAGEISQKSANRDNNLPAISSKKQIGEELDDIL